MNIVEYKKFVGSLNNGNYKFVKVRQKRKCFCCETIINEGEECLTRNPKNGKRHWICCSCIKGMLSVAEASASAKCVAFDDEGGYLAASEHFEEVCGEFIERVKNPVIYDTYVKKMEAL